LKTEVSIY